MKKKLSSLTLVTLLSIGVLVAQPSLGDHNPEQNSNSADILSVELAGTKPIPTIVTWVQSQDVEDGEVVLDHFEVVLSDNVTELDRLEIAPTVYSVELNKKNMPDLKVFSTYKVHVDEVYTDGTLGEGDDEYFYTAPPKLKKLRIKNKVLDEHGFSMTLKWRQPVNFQDELVYYEYAITNVDEPDELIVEHYTSAHDNSLNIDSLPTKSMQIRIRASTDKYGVGQWSKWKKFNAPAESE